MFKRSSGKRLDYKKLHLTGSRIYKNAHPESDFQSSSEPKPVNQNTSKISTNELSINQDESINQVVCEPINQVTLFMENLSIMDDLENESNAKKSDESSKGSASQDVIYNQLISSVMSLSMDIDDFIEENPVKDIDNSIGDMDFIIEKIELLRSTFRTRHKELELYIGEAYKEKFAFDYYKTIDNLKIYI